jgi:GNAT superfamily N-acetyltransferase
MTVELRSSDAGDADACDVIVASLPYFFGDPDGVEECKVAVRTHRGFVATDEGEVVGFLTMARHPGASAEITWMAVHADHRRGGIGRLLVERAASEMSAEGCRLLFVLTLGPSVPEDVADSYGGTRAFYAAMGFIPLREFALRNWNDAAALVLARPL